MKKVMTMPHATRAALGKLSADDNKFVRTTNGGTIDIEEEFDVANNMFATALAS